MDRRKTLQSLIEFSGPLNDIQEDLTKLGWGDKPVVTLTRAHIVAVIERYLREEIDAAAVADWAETIECREDISYETEDDEIVLEAIYQLANPYLQGELKEIVHGVLGALRLS